MGLFTSKGGSGGHYELVWNTHALKSLLEGKNGPIAHDLQRRAVKVESRAKLNASGRPGPEVQTGRLRASITYVIDEDEEGVYADIGTNVEYARYVEEGTVNAPPYPFLKPALSAAGD